MKEEASDGWTRGSLIPFLLTCERQPAPEVHG
jgi:hypothetical protein